MRLIFSIILIILSGITYGKDTSRLHKGENLLQSFPLPENGWTARQGTIDGDNIVEWMKAGNEDSLVVRIRLGKAELPAEKFRMISDESGKSSCAIFKSTLIGTDPINGFPRSIWRSDCERPNGAKLTVLHLYITGKDSGYYLTRSWKHEADEDSFSEWSSYLQTVNVCDTRKNRKAPCP